jgi:hypothetical protein
LEDPVTMLPADAPCVTDPRDPHPISALEKVLRGLSVFTMLMTVPQVLTIWVGGDAAGVSVVFLARVPALRVPEVLLRAAEGR